MTDPAAANRSYSQHAREPLIGHPFAVSGYSPAGVTMIAVPWPPTEDDARRAHDAFQDHQGVLAKHEYAAVFARHTAMWMKIAEAVVWTPITPD